MECIYYVYVYLDPRKSGKYVYEDVEFDYEPFYVGKGHGDRINEHLHTIGKTNPTNSFMVSKVNRIFEGTGQYPIRRKLEDGLTDADALALEQEWIGRIGRADLEEGPLTNHTNGGDGCRGLVAERNGMYGSGYKISGSLNGMYGVRGKDHHCYGKPGYWLGKKKPRELVEQLKAKGKFFPKGEKNPRVIMKRLGMDLTPPMAGMTYKEYFGEERAKEISEKMSRNHADFSGENNPAYGKPRPTSAVEKQKVSLAKYFETHDAAFKDRKHTKESKDKIRKARAKQVFSVETRKKMSEAKKGARNPFYSKKKHTEESKGRISSTKKKRLQTVTV